MMSTMELLRRKIGRKLASWESPHSSLSSISSDIRIPPHFKPYLFVGLKSVPDNESEDASVTLKLWINEGINLCDGKKGRYYCSCYMTAYWWDKLKTSTKKGKVTVKWGETMVFSDLTRNELRYGCLMVKVYKRRFFSRNKFIGCLRLSRGNRKFGSSLPERQLWQGAMDRTDQYTFDCLQLRSLDPWD